MVDRVDTVPKLGDLPTLVIAMLEAAVADYPIGDGVAAQTVPAYPHSIVYSLPAAPVQGSGGVDHERIQSATIQLRTVGESREQCDLMGDDLAAIMMGRTIRPRAWVNPIENSRIVVIDRQHRRGTVTRENGSPTWYRSDHFVLTVSPV